MTTYSILMELIPKADRSIFLTRLIASLGIEDTTGVLLVAALVSESADDDVGKHFVSFLEHLLQAGHSDTVKAVVTKHAELGHSLVARALGEIDKARSETEFVEVEVESLLRYLSLAKYAVTHLHFQDMHATLFRSCLAISSRPDDMVSKAAMAVVFALLETSINAPGAAQVPHPLIWQTICAMVAPERSSTAMQGYRLWLRYLLFVRVENWKCLVSSEYWQLLLHGLRYGDSERRKLCLHIIKLSIAADVGVVSELSRHQHERYCTVFETIVLGRYINQIQECEHDLDNFVARSDLEPSWLYCLLASALDPRMQETNRKFIGNWIMRSGLQLNSAFLSLIQDNFLPWAIQGQLYVSSLKSLDGDLRCVHGDALAAFIAQLNQDQPSSALVDVVVDTIYLRRNTIFAYAVVYLLKGIGDSLQPKHMHLISELRPLPEVARDYVDSRIATYGNKASIPKLRSRRQDLEEATLAQIKSFDGDMATLDSIWLNLEALENPKRLLLEIPTALSHPSIIHSASDLTTLPGFLHKLQTLQKVSITKIFLFPPLVKALRNALLANSATASSLPIADLIMQFIEHPPRSNIDLQLEEATILMASFDYERYFGQRPSAGYAALLDLVSRLRLCEDVVEDLLNRTLARWKAQKVPPPIVSTWKNTLQLQILLLCFEQVTTASDRIFQGRLDDLLYILAIEPLPSYRYLLEAITVRYILHRGLQDVISERMATKDHHTSPKHLASLMRISAMLGCHIRSTIGFNEQLLASLISLAASSKVIIRHEAQRQLPILMDHCRTNQWTSITTNPAYVALDSYIRSLERFQDPPLEMQLGAFDPEKDFTMSNLVEGGWLILDQTETPIARYDDFVRLHAEGLPEDAPQPCIPLGAKSEFKNNKQGTLPTRTTTSNTSLAPRATPTSSALQTKGAAYLARAISDPVSETSRPHEIIVVASLVDNPHNLGGISRVSEVFGASALMLQNQNVTSNKDFTSVAVSSHLHLPIVQLSAGNVPTFLAEKKQEGYTIVGIEQTDRSVNLGSEACRLPKKSVLVVGSEREGIPAVVLVGCDMLVEIPQVGITRSLNVQTAVGIVLYEYARQHQP